MLGIFRIFSQKNYLQYYLYLLVDSLSLDIRISEIDENRIFFIFVGTLLHIRLEDLLDLILDEFFELLPIFKRN
jgi:hypothetical protein